MSESTHVKCPACGSDNISEYQEVKAVKVPFGAEEKVIVTSYKCNICDNEGDFAEQRSIILSEAEEISKRSSINAIFNFFEENNFSLAYMERALELPQRTMTRWKNGEMSAPSLALVRVLRTYPWILSVAEDGFEEIFSKQALMKAAAAEFSSFMALINQSKDIPIEVKPFAGSKDESLIVGFSLTPETGYQELDASEITIDGSGINSFMLPLTT